MNISFRPEISLGLIVQTVLIIISIYHIARVFFKRIFLMEMKIDLIWVRNSTDEEKTLVRHYAKQLGIKNS